MALIEDGAILGGSSVPVVFCNGAAGEEYVFLKLYEGRAEGYYSLHFISHHDGKVKISKAPGVFGAPILDRDGLLVSTTHDGPFAKIEKYSIGERLRKVQSITPIDSDLEKVAFYGNHGVVTTRIEFLGTDVDACMVVVAEIAHISKEPKAEGRGKPYLIKGDVAVIRDISEDKRWMNIQYDERGLVRGWVPVNAVKVGDIRFCKGKG